MEVWKDIKGYEGYYQASSHGRIRSYDQYVNGYNGLKLRKGVTRNPHIYKEGYKSLTLSIKGTVKKYLVHRLIAETFIPNPENKETVNHKDLNKLNNNIENLEWCTHKENVHHAINNNVNPSTWIKIKIIDKVSNKVYHFRNQATASAFMGHNVSYIGKNKRRNKFENKIYKWEVL